MARLRPLRMLIPLPKGEPDNPPLDADGVGLSESAIGATPAITRVDAVPKPLSDAEIVARLRKVSGITGGGRLGRTGLRPPPVTPVGRRFRISIEGRNVYFDTEAEARAFANQQTTARSLAPLAPTQPTPTKPTPLTREEEEVEIREEEARLRAGGAPLPGAARGEPLITKRGAAMFLPSLAAQTGKALRASAAGQSFEALFRGDPLQKDIGARFEFEPEGTAGLLASLGTGLLTGGPPRDPLEPRGKLDLLAAIPPAEFVGIGALNIERSLAQLRAARAGAQIEAQRIGQAAGPAAQRLATEETGALRFKKSPIPAPAPPSAVPPTGGLLSGGLGDLSPFQQTVDVATRPDVYRRIALQAKQIPALRNIARLLNPAGAAQSPAETAVVGRAMQRSEGLNRAVGAFSSVRRLGDERQIFGAVDKATGTMRSGPLKGLTVNDVASQYGKYEGLLTEQQKKWLLATRDIEEGKTALLRQHGVEINELAFEDGGFYLGRRVMGKFDADGNLVDTSYVGTGQPARPGAKLAAEKTRVFASQDEGIKAGFRYLSQEEATFYNLVGAYNRVADKQMAEWLLAKVPTRTMGAPEELTLALEGARARASAAQRYSNVVNRAIRGERPPEVTLRSLETFFPSEGAQLRAAIGDTQALTKLRQVGKDLNLAASAERESVQQAATAARAASGRTFEEATVQAPAFAGRIFTGPDAKETADILNRAFSDRQLGLLRAINQVNAVQRLGALAGDYSVGGIQLFLLANSKPKQFAPAFIDGIRAMFSRTYEQELVSRGNQIIQRHPGLLLSSGPGQEFFQAVERGGLFTKGPLKIAGTALQPFQRAFNTALDSAGIRLAEALERPWHTAGEIADIDAFVNEIRGLANTARLGVSANQRAMESAVLLAPRYRRAIATIYADMLRGGIRGSEARKAIAATMVGTISAYIGISYALGQEPILDPTDFRFLSFKVAGQWVGPGSKLRSDTRAFAKMVENPDDLIAFGRDNPLFYAVNSQMAAVPSTAIDILTGRNFIGEPTRDGALHLTERIFAENLVPIWLQTVLFEGGTPAQRGARGGTEFFGGRAIPSQPMPDDLRNFLRSHNVDESRLTSFYDPKISPEDRRLFREKHQDIAQFLDEQAIKQAVVGSDTQRARAQRVIANQDRLIGEIGLEQELLRGQSPISGEEYRERYQKLQGDAAIRTDQANRSEGVYQDEKPPSDPRERAVYDYYLAYRNAEIPGGFDYDRLDESLAGLDAAWPPEIQEYVRTHTGQRDHPTKTAREFETLRKKLRETGYWDAYRYIRQFKENPALEGQYKEYLAAKRDPAAYEQWAATHNIDLATRIDSMAEEVKGWIRQNNPDIDLGLARFYGSDPVLPQNIKEIGTLSALPHIGSVSAGRLRQAGFASFDDIAQAKPESIRGVLPHLSKQQAAAVVEAARQAAGP